MSVFQRLRQGETLFGVSGSTCYCGDGVAVAARTLAHHHCSAPCPGNTSQLCGDSDTTTVFFVHTFLADRKK